MVALGLIAVLVVGSVLSGVLIYRHSHLTDEPLSFSNSGAYVPDAADTSKVKAVAEQYALRMDNLDSSNISGYVKSVGEILTTKYRTDFVKVEPLLVAAYAKEKFTTQGFVRATGIVTQDADSATVLVVHDKVKTPTTGQPEATAYRWTVELRKVDGDWLVDNFDDPDDNPEGS